MQRLSSAEHQYFLRTVENEHDDNFLVVHQSLAQKGLMERYGNEICLLDATYKTSCYALPLFLVVVPTNTSYQVSNTCNIFITKNITIEEFTGAMQKLL